MSVRVVVVTYNSGAHLERFLDSLAGAGAAAPIPVTIVDNGSVDGAPEAVADRAGVTVVHSGANLGYGGAANLGVRGATEDWVVVANPDLQFLPGAMDALVRAADRWPRAGALGPQIHTEDGLLYPSSRAIPSVGRGVGHALFGWIWPSNPWTKAYRRETGSPVEGVTGWLSGACLFLRREAFDAVGGFDEGFFMYFEDLDLCERIGRAGWDVVYAPEAVVVHVGGHSTDAHRDLMSRAHHRSAYRYLSSRYAGLRYAPLRLVLRAGLWGRYQVSRVVTRVSAGAMPTRSARRPESPPT